MHLLPGNGCLNTALQIQIIYLLPTDKKSFLTAIQNSALLKMAFFMSLSLCSHRLIPIDFVDLKRPFTFG
jgi:hypothetical protein